jgi:beta-mannosidase
MIKLNGIWKYISDSDSKLLIEQIKAKINLGEFSGSMKIPSNWELEGLRNFSGTIWFVRVFDNAEPPGTKRIVFGGIDYFSEVWVNGDFVGSHEGYFQTFDFLLDDTILTKKNNILIVRVTSPKEEAGKVWPNKKQLIKGIFNHHDCRPGGWSLANGQDKNTGGIWNDVCLVTEEKIIIDNLKLQPIISNEFNEFVEIKIAFHYRSFLRKQRKIEAKIQIKSGNNKIQTTKVIFDVEPIGGFATVIIKVDKPEFWYPWELGIPTLTKIKISSKYFNPLTTTIGIREVKLSEKSEFIINGKRLFLRGTNIIPEQFLSNLSRSKIKKLVTWLREANINIVRVHAHVNRKELYQEFDKAGILVWQDFALQWTYDASTEFKANAVSQIKDMVNQFYNHPSIVFWCCHNEPGEQIKTLDNYLFGAVKEEDQSRIVRKASNYEEHPYEGWYWGHLENYAATPMGPLVTEFGAQAIPVLSSLKKMLSDENIRELNWDKWEYHNFQYEQTFNLAGINLGKNIEEFISNSHNYQSELINKAVNFYRRKKNKGITGIFQFMFIDCWDSISWSLIDYYGQKKPGYSALRNSYEPFFISLNLKKSKYQVGAELFMDLWIINDLHIAFRNLTLIVSIENEELVRLKKIQIAEDSVLHIDDKKFKIKLPNDNIEGILSIKLMDSTNKTVCTNSEEIQIFDNRLGWT